MAGTKRSRADSETEEEKSNAKRHNGEAPEHEAEKEKPKEQPSQDHSKQAKKAEDGSESKQKRAREPESTDEPEAKRRAPSSQGETAYDHAHRVKLRTQVRACKTLADCGGILNKIPASNIIALAFALNDAKENHRRELFGILPKSLSSQIVDILANAIIDRKRYDPESLYPINLSL
ncbi:hypothetical protein BT63DRAFT_139723 [Microthyrium microscopicum]|uniref:Uncharacterized protein n=1 Tax=Microthyrium microscopicum TaxID=703497 RepID=A0A6A6UNA3_9PEZI|nr:hypothetical protein BT63DRAFT_139723 [Microthyrium microscopicum]